MPKFYLRYAFSSDDIKRYEFAVDIMIEINNYEQ